MKRTVFMIWLTLLSYVVTSAQVDYTDHIINPSFEQDAEGWVTKSMSVQGNNVFNIKDGQKYMEKWTGRGGAVGNGSLSQVLQNLPPGNYELTVAAQNIQEDTPQNAQSGAWIFVGDARTTVTVRDTYKVSFTFVSGSITIGFVAEGATGNWIACDNFRLTLVSSDLSKELNAAIEKIFAEYGDATGREIQQLLDAIEAARQVAARSDATAEEQAAAIQAVEYAVEVYRCANASPEQPMDLTDRIANPSFEINGLENWTASGMGVQGNNVFSIKKGTYYVEKWTGRGGAVGDARVAQRLTGMMPGRYRLRAAAQNIQEDTPQKAQSGAWIFANSHQEPVTVRNEYMLEFALVSDELEIGFEAVGATGNWLACDNFRLEYISDNFDDIKTELTALLATAEELATHKMNAAVLEVLQDAISTAQQLIPQSTTDGWSVAARQLENAIQLAQQSQEVYSRLATTIAEAEGILAASSATDKEDYENAIQTARDNYEAATMTDAEVEKAIETLNAATFSFRILNGEGTGEAPIVKTDPRFIRGCTWAFGRSTVSGKNIIEEGFCWSEQPDPKVTDHRTTEYLNQAGKIYWLRDLKPATVYYMRAYAITKDYAVGYGDVIKVVTVPKGTVGHWYNNGGDEETNNRINYAINTSMDYYWNNLTSIHGFGISVTYSPGTPTADCGYGGGMRVGASSSYQQPGTIMHEALHGIGVGTHGMWWSADMRSGGSRGDWLGDRVTEAVRFWDNNTTGVITGDDMHLWPYGCNGAHEDTHSDNLYCMMGILAQALNEDGLPGSGEIGYALPYYSFNHEDNIKYYIKNEDESRGLYSSYLVETSAHQLEWHTMTAEEAAADDHAAWYLSFTPNNQYYQIKNAATGYYMTYSNGFRTASHSKPTTADNIHLMRGRVDVKGHRGYYFIHPEQTSNPPVMIANTNGKTASSSFNISTKATTQRWLILNADEAAVMEKGAIDISRKELERVLAQTHKLAETPHTEDVEGADETLNSTLTTIELEGQTANSSAELEKLANQARQAAMNFLASVSAKDIEQPFDLTFMLQNPTFDEDATAGWTTSQNPGYSAGCDEFYETTFNFYQNLDDMPAGIYQLRANAFQRAGETQAAYKTYIAGNEAITTTLYINNTTAAVKSIFDDRQPKRLYTDGNASDIQLPDGTYVPNVMNAAAKYFAQGLYDSYVNAEQKTTGASFRVGIKCTKSSSWYWSFFDNFRLYFFGGNRDIVGIETLTSEEADKDKESMKVYDLSGRQLNTQHLKPGIYIIRGKKVVIK